MNSQSSKSSLFANEQSLLKIPSGKLLNLLGEEMQVPVFDSPSGKRALGKTAYIESILQHVEQRAFFAGDRFTVHTRGRTNSRKVGEDMWGIHTVGRRSYRVGRIRKIIWYEQEIVWAWHYGEFCPTCLDHIDGNGVNNQLNNLRSAPHLINNKNSAKKISNKSGFTGVNFHQASGKWQSRIGSNYKKIDLGLFLTAEEAHEARQAYLKAHPELGYTERHGQ